MKKKGRRETCLYSLSNSHSSFHQVIFVTFASAATCHPDKEDSPPPAHSPPGASVHFWSPTPTFSLPISRSETNGAAIFLPF